MSSPKSLSQLNTSLQLDLAASEARVTFYRRLVRQLEDVLGYDGNKETILDAAKRVVQERDHLNQLLHIQSAAAVIGDKQTLREMDEAFDNIRDGKRSPAARLDDLAKFVETNDKKVPLDRDNYEIPT